MRRVGWLALLGSLAACTPNTPIPDVKIPEICERQVYADPAVRDEIMKGAGSDYYRETHRAELDYAKLDATNRCKQQKGLMPVGGGVERPRSPSGSTSLF